MVSASLPLRLPAAGVVTCVFVDADAGDALARRGAAMVLPAGSGMIGAFRRMTDALHAVLDLRDDLPASRLAVCTGETSARGEFALVAERAARLSHGAEPGSTVLSKLAGVLAMDHLPRDRMLYERSGPGVEPCYELRIA
jgi:hypothetical protein